MQIVEVLGWGHEGINSEYSNSKMQLRNCRVKDWSKGAS